MAQSRLLILTDQHGQQLGAQLQAILQRENAYRVDVLAHTLLDGAAGLEPRPDLLIPLLPASKEQATRFCRKVAFSSVWGSVTH
jgi:hypothetical protein